MSILDKLLAELNGGKQKKSTRVVGCLGESSFNGECTEFDCGYGTTITCEECKYCGVGGRKDPAAKCNQPD